MEDILTLIKEILRKDLKVETLKSTYGITIGRKLVYKISLIKADNKQVTISYQWYWGALGQILLKKEFGTLIKTIEQVSSELFKKNYEVSIIRKN